MSGERETALLRWEGIGTGTSVEVAAIPVFTPAGALAGVTITVCTDMAADHRHLPEENPSPVIRIDGGATLGFANGAALSLLADWNLRPGGPAPEAARGMAVEALAQNGPIDFERTSGNRRFLIKAVPVATSGHVNFYFTDITRRAEIEHRLRESEEKFRVLSQHAPVGIFQSGADGRAVFVNHAWCSMAGMAMEDALGEGWALAIHPEDRQRVLEGWDRAVENHTASTSEFRFLHPDGTVVWVQGCALELSGPDGEFTGYLGSCADVTARKMSNALLQRQTEHLRLLWESAGVILGCEHPDLMLQRLFEIIGPHLGLDAYVSFLVEPSGQSLALFSHRGYTESQQLEIARLDFGQAVCGTVALQREPIVAKDIQNCDSPMVELVKRYGMSCYACNPLLAGDQLLGTLSFASRHRPCFEADEIAFLETISHYVTGAYVRWRLLEDLRLADRRKDEFLATLAHELRNPLAPIRTGLDVMRMAGNLSEPVELALGTMQRQVGQLVTLVNDLLDVSRITLGKLNLRVTRCQLAEVLRSGTEASMPLIGNAGHELDLRVPQEVIMVEADPHRLAQVISNLLNNAAKYTQPSGKIRLIATVAGRDLLIRVEDNGRGIPAEMLGRIFELFEQVEGPLPNPGGLGIGLTLVRSLVQLHAGTIRAESAGPGCGSTFHLRLPIVVESPQEEPPSGAHDPMITAVPKRVLIVDDNRDIAQTMGMAVKMLGHEVTIATNGAEALEKGPDFLPDVILMDLGMPIMDGWEAARRLRATPWGQAVQLVALTGWGQEGDRDRTRLAGFDQHLVKPTGLRELGLLLDAGRPATHS